MTTEVKLENQLCRCCHTEGQFTSLESSVSSKSGTFAQMLLFVLDIRLIPVSKDMKSSAWAICDECINKLTEARNFQQQVINCEEIFTDLYEKNLISVVETSTANNEIGKSPSAIQLGHRIQNPVQKYDTDFIEISIDGVSVNDEVVSNGEDRNKQVGDDDNVNGDDDETTNGGDDDVDDSEMTEDVKNVSALVEKKKNKPETKVTFRVKPGDYSYMDGAYHCANCDGVYPSFDRLRGHIKSVHSAWRPYKCNQCVETFKTLPPLVTHKLEEHGIDERMNCNACDKKFNTKSLLVKHTQSYHMLGVRLKCPFCDYVCYSTPNLNKHKYKHKTKKEYHCRFCKKSFMRKTTLTTHEMIHTGVRRKVCKECGQKFVQKASLNYHMAKHHPSIPF